MKKIILNVFSIFIILALLSTTAYAWYLNAYGLNPEDNIELKSKNSYFASGNGSKEKPYVISHAVHMYNLAWLQYLGQFNHLYSKDDEATTNIDESKYFQQYYFEIDPDTTVLDMAGFVLPPIGTTKYPFIGNFKGNGSVIKNLHVSNEFSDYGGIHPSEISSVSDVSIVGMFGTVGAYSEAGTKIGCKAEDGSYSELLIGDTYNVNCSSNLNDGETIINKVSNFYIDQLTVETIDTNSLVGLLAGYVNAGVTKVGVYASRFNLNSGVTGLTAETKLSSYTLIGDYNEKNISWEEKPTGTGGGGSGDTPGYGGSLNFLEIIERMKLITSNSWSSPSVTYNPDKDESSFPNSKNYMSLVVNNDLTPEYYGSNTTESVPSTNIGYFTGQDAKIVAKQTTGQIIHTDMYIKSGDETVRASSKITDPTTIVDFDIYEKDSNTTDVLYTKLDENIKNDILDILTNETNLLYSIRFNGQIEGNGWVTVNNANIVGYKNTTITIPPKSVWFVAQETGFAKIVFGAFDSSTRAPSFYRLTREEKYLVKDSNGEIINPYYSQLQNGVTAQGVSYSFITSVYENTDASGNISYSYNTNDESAVSSKIVFSTDWYDSKLTEDRLYYMQIPLVKGYEYAFGNPNSGGGRILYMDIGQNAGNEGTGGGTVITPVDAIAGIDFVYLDGTTYTALGEDLSNVVFALSGTSSTTIIYFRRDKTEGVLYLASGSGITITPSGSGASKESDGADDTFTTA